MASVNKVEVGGGIGPSGGLSALAGQAMAQRSRGGGVATSDPSVPQGLQGALPGQQPVKGSGKQWQQQQQEFIAIENNLATARNNAMQEENEVRMQLTRAVRDGRRDIEGQLRTKLKDISSRQTNIDKQLVKHQFMSEQIYKHFSGAHQTVVGPNGEEQSTKGAMYQQIHDAFKNHYGQKTATRNGIRTVASDALLLSLGEVVGSLNRAPGVSSKMKEGLREGGLPPFFLGLLGNTDVGNKLIASTVRITDKKKYDKFQEIINNEALAEVDWVGSFSRKMSEGIASAHKGKTVPEVHAAVDRFTRGLFAMASVSDQDNVGKENLRGHAKNVAGAIRDMKAMGITDIEIDALRDTFVDAGEQIRMGVDTGVATEIAQDAASEDSVGLTRFRKMSDPAMGQIADKLRRMGSEMDTLKSHFSEEEWDKAYEVLNYSELKGVEDWMANAIPQITAEFIASNGQLDEDQITGLMNQFDQDTQESILELIKGEFTKRKKQIGDYVEAEGYDRDELFGMNHRSKVRALNEQRNALVNEMDDLRFNTEGALNQMGDVAQDEIAQLMQMNGEEVAKIDEQLAQLSVMSDPAAQAYAAQLDAMKK